MQFLYPNFLWALTALLIPIAIHLFNLRRYKTIYFSDIRFLKEVEQNTRKQKKIKEWLVLISRLLAFSALVIAFARPYLPSKNDLTSGNQVVIFVDNSASTSVGADLMSPFETSKKMALELLEELPEESRIALVTAATGQLFFENKQQIKSKITDLVPEDQSYSLAHISELIGEEAAGSSIYFFSDFQKNQFSWESFNNDSLRWIFIPVTGSEDLSLSNSRVDSVWIEAPFLLAGQPVEIFLRIRQFGEESNSLNLEVLTNNKPEITFSADLAGNTDTIIKVPLTQLTSGFNTAQINILNDKVNFDDRIYLSYNLPIANQIVEVYETTPSPLVSKLFSGNEFEFQSVPSLQPDYQNLQKADLIILNDLSSIKSGLVKAIAEYSDHANILIIPNLKNNEGINELAGFLGFSKLGGLDTARLATIAINQEDPFFKDVFAGKYQQSYWPTVRRHFKLNPQGNLPSYNLLSLANGDPLFVRYNKGNTNIYLLTASLDDQWSDLANHPVIVPVFIKSLMKKDNASVFSGFCGLDSRFDLTTDNINPSLPVKLEKGKQLFIPRQQMMGNRLSLSAGESVNRAGFYNLTNGKEMLGTIAFNLPASESNMSRYSFQEISDLVNEQEIKNVFIMDGDKDHFKSKFTELQQGIHLWKYALTIALLFVFIEVILLRFMK